MYNRTFTDNKTNKEYIRIDKRKARNMYKKGISIILCADNLQPFTVWNNEIEININNNIYEFEQENDNSFDKYVNQFTFYNCINSETGYHTAFYMEVKKI